MAKAKLTFYCFTVGVKSLDSPTVCTYFTIAWRDMVISERIGRLFVAKIKFQPGHIG